MPPTKRTTSKSTRTKVLDNPTESGSDPAERLQDEAELLDANWIEEEFEDDTIRVKPIADWPRSVYQAVVHGGDVDALSRVIHPDDVEVWEDYDGTTGPMLAFINRVAYRSGQAMGESRASRRSSRRTARR